ncbi:MAG TPA: DNA polymerase III subunit delta [Caldilineaceae bacterium]|nr:DNA polymerase III subunit delta [Caldilineaceae bacterium]
MVYLLLNCDEYLAAQRIAALKQALGDAELTGLNSTELAGERTGVAAVLGQASLMPFLTERRLVLVSGLLSQLESRMAQSKSTDSAAYQDAARLLEGLPKAPATCDLVLVDDTPDKRRALWRGFSLPATENQPERKITGLEGLIKSNQVTREELATPEPKALPGWIQQQAKARQIAIEGRAVQLLADFVGSNLRQLNNELEKLSLYAGPRAITAADVRLLVSDAAEALIWDLTDALSVRNGREAMTALYDLRRSDANPFQLLGMVARQVRILIKVKEALGRGPGDEFAIAQQIGEKPYPVKKAMSQSARYSSTELDDMLDRLLATDYALKTGADVDTEIDLLVAELTLK